MAADPHPFTAFAGQYSTAWIDHLAETEDPGPTPARCTTRWPSPRSPGRNCCSSPTSTSTCSSTGWPAG